MLPKIFRSLGPIGLFAATLAFVPPVRVAAQNASSAPSLIAPRITQTIDESSRVTLKGNVHPLANAANDRGVAPESMSLDRITIFFKRSDAQESALKQLISDLHAPGSPSYHKWLTPDEFGKQFGPSDQDLATVQSWLASHGFSVTKVNAGRQSIEFTGNARQFRDTFHAQIHKYAVNGEIHYANATDPQIPSALAPVIGGFASLNNFRLKSYARKLGTATYDPATRKTTPQWTLANGAQTYFALSPGDFGIQYDLPNSNLNSRYSGTNYDGTGQTIAIVNDSNINVYLVNQFRSLFGLSSNPPQVIIDGNDPGVDGINNPDGPNGDSVEAYLDVEWSGAVAPNAQIDLIIAADTAIQNGLTLALEHAIYGNVAPVVSLSFGACESALGSSGNRFLYNLFQQGAAQGQTILVSTGDAGSAGCDDDNTQQYAVNGQAVSGYASTPYTVAVGGTDFVYLNSSGQVDSSLLSNYWNTNPHNSSPKVSIQGYIPEQPWNSSQYGLNLLDYYQTHGGTTIAGGGGGASNAGYCSNNTYDANGNCTGTTSGYPKPSWQTGTGVPSDGVRDIPDVSLFASSGSNYSFYVECYADADCQSAASGGTIQYTAVGGTSASAPAFAGIMALINQKYGRQGQADFVLYPLASQFPSAFHDVTHGTNSVPCAYSATASQNSPDCISVQNPITVGNVLEGQIGFGTTAEYNATTGYDLGSGLGTVDASVLLADWGKISFASTTTTLTPSSTSFAHGTSITISGSVTSSSGTPTGNVALMTDSTEPLQQGQTSFKLSSGSYSGSANFLPGGTYNVWGQYGGDSSNGPSTSQKTSITVSPESSSVYFNVLDVATPTSGTAAIASGGTADYGTQLILSAVLVPTTYYNQCINVSNPPSSCSTTTYGVPTGTVTFADNGSTINTAVVNAEGDAEYNAPWSVGSHSVTASYSGDNSYNSTSASAITFKIQKNTPNIDSASSALNSGQSSVFTVRVMNSANLQNENAYGIRYSNPTAAPTGTVTISGFPSGVSTTATLQPGVDGNISSLGGTWSAVGIATITLPSTVAAGSYNVTVSYPGDSNYNSTSQLFKNVQVQSASGLASNTTASTSGSISPSTTLTISGTVTGQSGHAAPTGQVSIYSSGYSLGTVGVTPGSGSSSTFSANVDSRILLQGSNSITVQYEGDSTYAPSAYTLTDPISNPLSDFTMVPETTIVPVSAGGSGTVTINLSSTNNFSGSVSLACSGSTVTCSLSNSAPSLSAGGSTSITLTINAGALVSTGNYNVSVTGRDSTSQYIHSLAIQAVVTPPSGGFALSNSGGITVSQGNSGTATISVTPSGGFTGSVALSCNSSNSSAVSCSLNPTTANVTGTSAVTSTLTINASSNSGALDRSLDKLFTVGGGAILALLVFFGIPARRRSWRAILGVVLFGVVMGLGIGCGSSGSGSGGGGSASYTITVTGTSGSTSQSTTVNVTVDK
ncbi:MAG TPA: Ig-like domain repeat protein [Silvibacterium sp.]|nr:Ig-like domain repeat protein [Silvibacterium sp.]